MKLFGLATLAALASTASATCNPLTTGGCSADPALGTSFRDDFQENIGKYFTVLDTPGSVTFGDDGVELTIKKRYDNPSFQSDFYIMFGKVEVVMQAAEGKGIISSFYLQSDDLDEIDIELFGGDGYEFQSNYFVKGNTTTYDRGVYHPTSSNPLENFHTYTIDWTEDSLTWSLDGTVVRTIPKDNAQGYPQSPMQIFAGTWAGGDPGNAVGTIEWAGGLTDYSQAPFSMKIKSVIVSDYSTGDSYSYSDKSGSWESIVAKNGEVNGRLEQGQSDFAALQSGGSVDSKTSAEVASDSSSSYSSISSTSSSATTSSTSTSSTSTTSSTSSTVSSTSTSSTSTSTSSTSTSTSSTFTSSSSTSSTSASSTSSTPTTVKESTTTSPSTLITTRKDATSTSTTSSTSSHISTLEGSSSKSTPFFGLFALVASVLLL